MAEKTRGQPAARPSWIVPKVKAGDSPGTERRFMRKPSAPRMAAVADPSRPPPAIEPAIASAPPPAPATTTLVPPREPVVSTVVNAELAHEMEELRNTVARNVAGVAAARRAAIDGSEREVVELARAIAEEVIGRELKTDPGLFARFARAGLDAIRDKDVVVAIAPDLADVVPAEKWQELLDGAPPVIDSTLPPGGCEVRSKTARADASLQARLVAVLSAIEDDR